MALPARTAYIQHAMVNLARTSRTVSGKIVVEDTGKEAAITCDMSPSRIAGTASDNYRQVIGYLYDNRQRQFCAVADLRNFVEDISRRINAGITKNGVLYRTYDSQNYPYTKVAALQEAADEFFRELYERLISSTVDPVETAAWIEYRMDLTDHLWADGCGKSAKAIAAWVLIRSGHGLPTYPASRSDQFTHAPSVPRTADPRVELQQYATWLRYYRSLFQS